MADFTPIRAFNDTFDFADAYSWEEVRIFEFLKDVVDDVDQNLGRLYGVPEGNRGSLRPLYDYMSNLRRTVVKDEVQLLLDGNNILPSEPFGWNVNEITEQYFILFDFLGIFLSLMGPAPTTKNGQPVTRDELTKGYFLPLAAVYARWCDKLATARAPTVVQITWTYKSDGTDKNPSGWYSFLGASFGGVPKSKKFRGLTNDSVKRRFEYLERILDGSGWELESSPERVANGPARQRFGNCAETYPFLYILEDENLRNNSYGIAVNIPRASQIAPYNGQSFWVPGPGQTAGDLPLMPPCLNCRELFARCVFPECRRHKDDTESPECTHKIDSRLGNFRLWDPRPL